MEVSPKAVLDRGLRRAGGTTDDRRVGRGPASRADPHRQAAARHAVAPVAGRDPDGSQRHADPRGDPDARGRAAGDHRATPGRGVATLSIDDIEELFAVRSALEGARGQAWRAEHRAEGHQGDADRSTARWSGPATRATRPPSWRTTAGSTRCCTRRRASAAGRPGSTTCSRAVAGSSIRTSTARGIRSRSRPRPTGRSSRPSSVGTGRSTEQLIRDNIARAGERALVAFEEDASRIGPTTRLPAGRGRIRPGRGSVICDHGPMG